MNMCTLSIVESIYFSWTLGLLFGVRQGVVENTSHHMSESSESHGCCLRLPLSESDLSPEPTP